MSNQSYSVEFRIEGTNVVPDLITTEMALSPTQVRNVGDPRGSKGAFSKALWSYSGPPTKGDWPDLDRGLNEMLSILRPKKSLIKAYCDVHSVYWWCAHFHESFDGVTIFSSITLNGLSDIGVPLKFVSYRSDDDH